MSGSARRDQPVFRCASCGWESPKWVGRCGECLAWGTVDEGRSVDRRATSTAISAPATPIAAVVGASAASRSTGIAELDRVLGNGLVAGSVVLLAGEPGVGKSTLALQVAAQAARDGLTTLYVSGEESAGQLRLRAERTGALEDRLLVAAEVELAAVLRHVADVKPGLLVVDSVQTISDDAGTTPGGVSQVRAVTAALVNVAKTRSIPTILVGHVTKDGSIAGPRVLEHLVDVVLQFEGDPTTRLRLLRALKNRFGPVDEIGCFDLSGSGIVEVSDPSGLFVSRHAEPVAGTCLTVTVEGRRALLAEVQALVADSLGGPPRRAVSGLDSARVAMLLAVVQRRVGIRLSNMDVYASTVGGASLRTHAADLPLALAIASAQSGAPLGRGLVAFGEVGLAGELRRVPHTKQRLAEAARLGCRFAIVPGDDTDAVHVVDGQEFQVTRCADLRTAVRAAENWSAPIQTAEPPDLRLLAEHDPFARLPTPF